ncbi:hypothetical protein LY474_39915 [Myxococcus stipitatus]|uniref:hypothetical protein n=1 Tax=Myxococcus stipitatus TaxID=83455 RepID=UPI001F1695FE|nr:hypothetical protein [Myxococcus stipitatus]MCE9673976.1 hypothetical protein [Myxococcus stipitatus]
MKRWGIKNGVVMGTLNAGCAYFPKERWKTNPLCSDSRFTWLISDDINTVVGKKSCPYDRAVVAGDKMRANAKQGSTVYVSDDLKLSADSMALVSDHYPIQFIID